MREIYCFALVAALVACGGGGGGVSSSGPLSRRFDDMYVAGVPMDQKAAMLQSQNDWSRARMEAAKADSDLHDADLQLQLAKNEVKGAKLKEDSARAEKKSADASADTNKINEAMRAYRAAEKFRQAGEVRVKYLEAYREYMKQEASAGLENQYWREAQYELAKAKVAKANSIAPKGFSYDDFTRQEQERSHRAASSRDKAGKQKQKALEHRSKWIKLQGEADTMIGVKNQLPDPMAPKPVTGTDMTRGAGGITIGNGNGTGSGSSTPQ
jgi:hypothetical protein